MNSVYIQELNTPESSIMRYIAHRIGLNVRPGSTIFNEESKTWEVSLKALVPSQVQLSDNASKTFVYSFKNLGTVYVKTGEDGKYKIVERPKALEIEGYLIERFADLTSKIEKEILDAGSQVWGELTYTRMWLRPFYTAVVNALTSHNFMRNKILPENQRYIDMLVSSGFLEYEQNNEIDLIVPSNTLKGIAEQVYSKSNNYAEFETAKIAVGSLFANHYSEIRSDFKIYVPSAYVDTTKAYYMDAVRVGQSINISEDELWLKYRILGNRQALRDKSFSFPTVIAEIVGAHLLNRDENENLIANENILERVLPFREEISQVALEL